MYIYFVSCNGPGATKEKWHRKERIIIIGVKLTLIRLTNRASVGIRVETEMVVGKLWHRPDPYVGPRAKR